MTISSKLDQVFQQALAVRQCVTESPSDQTLLNETLNQLYFVLEELRTAEEEIQRQNHELRDIQQQLISERQRYQNLFNQAPDGYLVTDPLGLILEANQAIARLLRVERKSLIGKPLLLFIAEGDRPIFYEKLKQLAESNSLNPPDITNWQVRLCPRQGDISDVAISISMTTDPQGRLVNTRWLLRDITEQKKIAHQLQQLNATLEQQVQERTAQLQQSVNFSAVLKRITDRVRDSLDEQQILDTAVRELAETLGTTSCDTGIYDLRQRFSTITHEYLLGALPPMQGQVIPMGDYPEIYPRVKQGETLQFCRLPGTCTHRSQNTASLMLVCPIISHQDVLGDIWLYRPPGQVFTDLEVQLVQQVADQCAIALRQSRLYQAARHQVTELERLNQIKDDFLNSVSHELRTPMTSIQMATELLEVQLRQHNLLSDDPTAQIPRYFYILKHECHREIQLIENLLTLSRIDLEPDTLMPQRLQLQSAISHIAVPFLEKMDDREQDFHLDVPEDLYLDVNISYLERIFMELFSNASKFSPEGAQILVTAHGVDNIVHITVTNTGVSIVPVECDRMFDRFYRIPSHDPWKHGGTGLGLALVKSLVEKLNGHVHAESDENAVRIVIELPQFRDV
jgi:PAS domain S-box-containing protein